MVQISVLRIGKRQETQSVNYNTKKNTTLDILERDKISPDDLKAALTAAIDITDRIEEIENSPRKRIDKNKVVVEFHIYY